MPPKSHLANTKEAGKTATIAFGPAKGALRGSAAHRGTGKGQVDWLVQPLTSRIADFEGKRFGRLVVLGRSNRTKKGVLQWRCRCDCGTETCVVASNLTSGNTQSCGCLHSERTTESNRLDITGRVFGRLTVISYDRSVAGKTWWNCRCTCGVLKSISSNHLNMGPTTAKQFDIVNRVVPLKRLIQSHPRAPVHQTAEQP
jgi:hypothetical protein